MNSYTSLVFQYTAETQAIQFRLEKNKKTVIELTTMMTAVEEKKQEATQLCISDRAQALKVTWHMKPELRIVRTLVCIELSKQCTIAAKQNNSGTRVGDCEVSWRL